MLLSLGLWSAKITSRQQNCCRKFYNNSTVKDAASAHIPIDVFPLHYDVQNAVLLDKLVAPPWKREKEPFTVDVVLRRSS